MPAQIVKSVLIVSWLLACQFAQAQSTLGSWNIVNAKYHPTPRLSFFVETQLRSLKLYNHFHYYEVKGGVTVKIFPSAAFTVGAGSYQTYGEGGDFVLPKNNSEFRLWPQIALLQSVGALNIDQRYRAELRFTSNGYRNRYRYRLGLTLPMKKVSDAFARFELSASNEIFFTDREAYFERNRLLFSLEYALTDAGSIQLGYLKQFDYRINDETGRQFFQIGYFVELWQHSNTTRSTGQKDN
jgi:hypothetical protein